MLKRPRRQLEVLTISALDLFASALGVFILMAILLFPYYLKQPSLELDIAGATAELQAAAETLTQARQTAAETAEAKADADAAKRQAKQRLRQAEAEVNAASQSLLDSESRAQQAAALKGEVPKKGGNFQMPDLDLVFVMDATGSMGEEIEDVQTNLISIIRILHRLAPTLNVGFVAFKDRGDEYLARTFPLSSMNGANIGRIQGFVEQLRAKGGGDYPEPVDHALKEGLDMDWRDEAEGRIIVIGDAPAQRADWNRTFQMAAAFNRSTSKAGVDRRVSAIFTGARDEGREFYERLAEAGQGDFVNHRGRMIESVLLSVLAEKPR